MNKICPACRKPAGGGPICAECHEKRRVQMRAPSRLTVGGRGSYGYRLTRGFNLMNYIDDEYVEKIDVDGRRT